MKPVRGTWVLGGLLVVILTLITSDAGSRAEAQAVVSDCNGQDDGTPCNGDNGVTNFCFLPGATCQDGLCHGARMSCPDLQECSPTTGSCVATRRERALERGLERRR